MSKRKITIQIRPSVSVDVAMVLEEMAKVEKKYIGQVIEELLEESERFRKTKKAIKEAVKEAVQLDMG